MTPLSRRRAEAAPAPFVVGVGRSGTTLLRLMLDAHPELAIPPETHFLAELAQRSSEPAGELVELVVSARTWGDFGLDPQALRDRVRATGGGAADVARSFYGLYAEAQGKPRWGDKTPGYVKRMRAIGDLLSEARFVHLIRDGRDVALSRRARGMGEGKPIAETAALWRRRIENARRQARRLRGRYLELRYEDLVADPEPALRSVCELAGLEFDPAMLSHHRGAQRRLEELGDLAAAGARRERSEAERRAAHSLAAQPPSDGRVGAWRERLSAADRRAFEAEAGGLLAELGYDVAS